MPYSKKAAAERPFGLIVPFRVAEVEVILVAGLVVADVVKEAVEITVIHLGIADAHIGVDGVGHNGVAGRMKVGVS